MQTRHSSLYSFVTCKYRNTVKTTLIASCVELLHSNKVTAQQRSYEWGSSSEVYSLSFIQEVSFIQSFDRRNQIRAWPSTTIRTPQEGEKSSSFICIFFGWNCNLSALDFKGTPFCPFTVVFPVFSSSPCICMGLSVSALAFEWSIPPCFLGLASRMGLNRVKIFTSSENLMNFSPSNNNGDIELDFRERRQERGRNISPTAAGNRASWFYCHS